MLNTDAGNLIRLLVLDAGRAEAAVEAQLAIFAKALVYDGGVGGTPFFHICWTVARLPMFWPTLPPGYAEVSALMKQLAADKSGGFAELDLVTLSTMQEQLHAFLGKNMPVATKEYGGVPCFSQLHMTSFLMSCAIIAAPNRAAAASVAAELGMSSPDPAEFTRQQCYVSSTMIVPSAAAVAEALLVLGHAESALEFTGEAVRA